MKVKIATTAKAVVATEKNRQAANAETLAEMSSPALGTRQHVAVVTSAIRPTVQRKRVASPAVSNQEHGGWKPPLRRQHKSATTDQSLTIQVSLLTPPFLLTSRSLLIQALPPIRIDL